MEDSIKGFKRLQSYPKKPLVKGETESAPTLQIPAKRKVCGFLVPVPLPLFSPFG